HKAGKDSFLVINYDGTFEEGSSCAVLAASRSMEQDMVAYIRREAPTVPSLEQAVDSALRAWGLGDRLQREGAEESSEEHPAAGKSETAEAAALYTYLRDRVEEQNVECALLDRSLPGSSKYRALATDEIGRLLPK